jgi:DNA-binding transcriptional ArsR family regulator
MPMAVNTLTTLGALLADHTRATVLVVLMDGRAQTAGELARHARVAPSTMSQHLARLEQAGIVEAVPQGRHRYFRIASDEVGLLLETLGGLEIPVPAAPTRLARAPEELRFARSCYDHLAGELAVRMYRHLLDEQHLTAVPGGLRVTASGRALFAELGVNHPESETARPCLDWTERRDHLAGPAAAALFTTMLERRWIVRGTRPRSVRITAAGSRGLAETLGLTAS